MLFSEPKIPQFIAFINSLVDVWKFQCSSASRKFLNIFRFTCVDVENLFQCSSASRKFLNGRGLANGRGRVHRFSALQRAENSSMIEVFAYLLAALGFSALQRAENSSIRASRDERYMHDRFSALQRAENSSMRLARCGGPVSISFSALQRAENSSMRDRSSAI